MPRPVNDTAKSRATSRAAFTAGAVVSLVPALDDDRPGVPIDDLVEHYAPQVRAYAQAWADLVGPVGEIGLFFVHSGTYCEVDGPGAGNG